MTSRVRILPPIYDRKGNPHWTSVMSPPDDSLGVIAMVPDRIIPIIFVPGVMGSNLKGAVKWRLDSELSMMGWIAKKADDRKRYLTPTKMTLDEDGVLPEGTEQSKEELKRRGWGEVGAISYSSFLVWLENALSDYHSPKGGPRDQLIGQALGAMKGETPLTREQVALTYKYRFPVHACGYNWLDDNVNASKLLKTRIDAVIKRYKREGKLCEKVILVTHSMGGLVARHCSEVLNESDNILGIVHGVMPAVGAAAVYRRFKAGTEGSRTAARVLGKSAAEMTAVLSSAPGPMQLLPTPEYGNNWLNIVDGGNVTSLPKNGDPYSEIYAVRGKWWSMCDDQLINPLNNEPNPTSRRAQIDKDWEIFIKIIEKQVKAFHNHIKDKYHANTYAFFGSHQDNFAYGTVTWTGKDINSHGTTPRNGRPSDPVNARSLDFDELELQRTVATPLDGTGINKEQKQLYSISSPDEVGDGTVPHRSGVAPKGQPNVKALLQVKAEHEAAFRDSQPARNFTLRAIVQIAQEVRKTSLHYGEGQ